MTVAENRLGANVTGSEEDRVLVECVRRGDDNAFASLYIAHRGAVQAVARGILRDDDTVADVVQETFVRALENLTKLMYPTRFRAWLLGIARHVALDACARHRSSAFDQQAAEALPDRSPQPDIQAESAELIRLVGTCVLGLSRRDATAISLVSHLGFSPAELATALNVTPGAAKVIVHRARRRLRDALALELLVRHRGTGCETLEELLDGDEVVAAARHLKGCPACERAAADEVRLYDSSPTTRTPDRWSAAASDCGKADGFHARSKPPTSSEPTSSGGS